jgi:hypothetical protein
MQNHSVRPRLRPVGGNRVLHIEIALELGIEPMRGRLRADREPECDFQGVLELLALLDQLRDTGEGTVAPAAQ